MKEVRWNLTKSERLKKTRGVSFEELLNKGKIIEILRHPRKEQQQIMLFLYKWYVWVVPFVEEKDYLFLKTLYPSRKLTRIFKERGLS